MSNSHCHHNGHEVTALLDTGSEVTTVNVCLDDIFWITEHFVTKFVMAMQHHEPECSAEKKIFAIFKVTATARAHMIKIWLFLLYFLYCRFLGNQTWWYIIRSQCHVKKNGLLHSGSRLHQRGKMLVFFQMISSEPPSILFPNLVLWCIMQELIWSKYDNFYSIFWTANPFATKLCLIVHYHKPECLMEKLDCCVQGQGHSKVSKCSECLSRYLLNLIWWCIIMSQIVFQ